MQILQLAVKLEKNKESNGVIKSLAKGIRIDTVAVLASGITFATESQLKMGTLLPGKLKETEYAAGDTFQVEDEDDRS